MFTGDLGNQGGGDIGSVHFFERGDDFTGCHTLGMQEKDLVIHRGKPALVLFDQAGFEAAGPISRGVQFKLALFSLQGLGGLTVAVIVCFGLLMFGKAKVVVQFGIECCLDGDLGQHPAGTR